MRDSELGYRKYPRVAPPGFSDTFRRFPVEFLLSLFLTVFVVCLIGFGWSLHDIQRVFTPVITAGVLAFLWSAAVNLHGQKHKVKPVYTRTISFTGIAIVFLLHAYADVLMFEPKLFIPAIFLSAGLVAFIGSDNDERAYWLFNHKLWVNTILVVSGAYLVCTFLFYLSIQMEQNFEQPIILSVPVIIFLFVVPVLWLSLLPNSFDEKIPSGRLYKLTADAQALIAKYLIIPVALTLSLIVHGYALTMLMSGFHSPQLIAVLVLICGLCGAAGIFSIYPNWRTGGWLTVFFWKYWFALTLVPLVLLGISLIYGIQKTGVTSNHVIFWMVGLWLSYLALAHILPGRVKSLRFVVGVLCVFMLTVSFGPWGARSLGVEGQLQHLKILLGKNGMLENQRVRPVTPAIISSASLRDIEHIRDILFFLAQKKSIRLLEPMFTDVANSPFVTRERDDHIIRLYLQTYFRFAEIKHRDRAVKYRIAFDRHRNPSSIPIHDYQLLAGPFETVSPQRSGTKINSFEKIHILGTLNEGELWAQYHQDNIDFTLDGKRIASLNVGDLFHKAKEYAVKQTGSPFRYDWHGGAQIEVPGGSFIYKLEASGISIAVVVQRISAQVKGNIVMEYDVAYWILAGKSNTLRNE